MPGQGRADMVTKIVTVDPIRDGVPAENVGRNYGMQCRQEERLALYAPCQVRSGPGLSQRATVSDISAEGCALRSPRLRFRRTEEVEVTFGKTRTLIAEVRWSRLGEAVGLRFKRPLNRGDVHQIAKEVRRASINCVVPRAEVVIDKPAFRPVC
ncbi:PilZ domain-containing protein [Croceicoccus ponticola]|uniref:PilZ domain-containing protein n=1 Tax=Croceicoccus ponticola TaxID=2217664 RepID=A0A437H0H3_9SPHN|nr:PilZ domain-containing protein [Croceicoccus ponticola]RVQ69130.1 PilZ domain-containing protein [Croceicoccus ponticola]